MLILSRQKGEAIKIGDAVSVVILDVNGNQIKLEIDAPRSVAVNRSEIHQKIQSGLSQNNGHDKTESFSRLEIFDGNCAQIQRGESLINQLQLSCEYGGVTVNEFCFDDAGHNGIKIRVDLGLNDQSESWDKEFIKTLPPGFEDFFDDKNNNDFFYAHFV